jgi:hypothetical protein
MAAAAAANQAPSDRLTSYPDQPSYQPWRSQLSQERPQGEQAVGQQQQHIPPVQAQILPSQQYNGGQQEARRISLSEISRQLDPGQATRLRPNDFVLLKTLGTGASSLFSGERELTVQQARSRASGSSSWHGRTRATRTRCMRSRYCARLTVHRTLSGSPLLTPGSHPAQTGGARSERAQRAGHGCGAPVHNQHDREFPGFRLALHACGTLFAPTSCG